MLLVHLGDGTTFRLNSTGRAIWNLLSAGLTAAEVTERLHSELGVSAGRLRRDVEQLLKNLLKNALLEPLPEKG